MKTIWELEQFLKQKPDREVVFYHDRNGKFYMHVDDLQGERCTSLTNAIDRTMEQLRKNANLKPAKCAECQDTKWVWSSAFGSTPCKHCSP